MKLMLVINNAFSAFHLKGAVRYFSEKGHDVSIMSTPGKLVDQLAEEEGGRVIPIRLNRDIAPLEDIRSLIQLLRILKKEKPDVINVGSPKTGFLFALAKVFVPKLPMIFTLRGIRSDTLTGLKRAIVFKTEKLACSMAEKVIVISPSLRDHAVEIGMLNPAKAVVFGAGSSNGINTELYNLTDEWVKKGEELKSQLGISPNAVVMTTIGRVTKDKGLTEVYEAYKRLASQHAELHWLVAGPAEEGDPLDPKILKSMVENSRIHLLGQVNPIQPVIAASTVVIQYSYREGFGNVVLQAMAMKRPVVIADIPGLRDTLGNSSAGLRIQPKDSELLATSINNYLTRPDLCEQHGEFGRKRVEQHFASEVIWEAQSELYAEISGSK